MSAAAQPIRLLTFDLDDTLWELRPVLELAETTTWEWLVARVPAIADDWDVQRLRELRIELMRANPTTAHRVTRLRLDSIEQALSQCGVDATTAAAVAKEAFEIFLEARHQVTLFDQAEAVLSQLSQRYLLGAITNGNACVTRLGLGHFFAFAIQAETLARAKPHADPFEEALRLARCTPEAAIHIGDHCEHDIDAAQALGIGAIWVNREGQPWPGTQPPLAEIRTIAELPAAIAAIEAARAPG